MVIPIILYYVAYDLFHIDISQGVSSVLIILIIIFMLVGMGIGIIFLNKASQSDRLKWQKETREKIIECNTK